MERCVDHSHFTIIIASLLTILPKHGVNHHHAPLWRLSLSGLWVHIGLPTFSPNPPLFSANLASPASVPRAMPCLYISTNVNLDGVDVDPIFSRAVKDVSSIVGRPEKFVMVILKGSLNISFGGNQEPAAYGELVAMGGINSAVKRKLIDAIGSILQDTLLIPPTRFFLKVYDTRSGQQTSKL